MFNKMLNIKKFNTPRGIRIPVASLKERCPRPLDDGGLILTFMLLNSVFTVNS